MAFPSYVHSVIPSADAAAWPVEGQGFNECGCTAASNALNLLVRAPRFRKDDFVRQAGLLFQRKWGGSLSPVTGLLIQRNGFGTHFGNLSRTDYELVLRDLIDRGVPVVIELGVARVGPFAVYGQHSVVLVGYSDPFRDQAGRTHEEYYLVDSQWPALGSISLTSNNVDVDGDGRAEVFPGNRTLSRQELREQNPGEGSEPLYGTLWSYVNGMESPLVLLAFALYFLYNATLGSWHGGGPFGLRRIANILPLLTPGLACLLGWMQETGDRRQETGDRRQETGGAAFVSGL